MPTGKPPPGPEPIRVLRVFSRLNVGGPAVHVILVTEGLGSRGYETRLLVGREEEREGNLHELAVQKGVRCEEVPALGREIRPLSDLRALVTLVRAVREFRPHIVHTHTAKAGVLGRLAAVVARVPVVVHTFHGHVLQGYFGRVRNAVFRVLERALARRSDVLIAVSASVKQDLVRLRIAAEDKIHVVPLGLDLERLAGTLPRGGLRRESGVPDDAPLVGIVGRLAPIKDVGTFLAAAALVRAQRADVRFAVVGDGAERGRLEAAAASLGEAVFFHGWKRDMASVYGDLDLVVNCSRNEGTPVALIEALAANRPVVATSVGGTPDLLGGGSFGLLVAPADPKALADAILTGLRAPDAAKERTLRGRDHVLRLHALPRLLDDLDDLYRRLLLSPGCA
ncbi:MAG TPA: glycosyltransferase [Vicinamibacteria bacterium]